MEEEGEGKGEEERGGGGGGSMTYMYVSLLLPICCVNVCACCSPFTGMGGGDTVTANMEK